jgi:hypothetical protein
VDLAQQASRQRQLRQPRQPVLERTDVVRDLAHVVERHAWHALVLEQQQVAQRRLRALDLRRHHDLAADVAVDQERDVGDQPREPIEATDRLVGARQEAFIVGGQGECRDRG